MRRPRHAADVGVHARSLAGVARVVGRIRRRSRAILHWYVSESQVKYVSATHSVGSQLPLSAASGRNRGPPRTHPHRRKTGNRGARAPGVRGLLAHGAVAGGIGAVALRLGVAVVLRVQRLAGLRPRLVAVLVRLCGAPRHRICCGRFSGKRGHEGEPQKRVVPISKKHRSRDAERTAILRLLHVVADNFGCGR